MTVWRLDKDILAFPDPHYGEDDGLIAVGGDLSVDRLLLAYSNGIFPWYGFKERQEIMWFCPMDRFVIFPEKIHVSHSMRTLINHRTYHVTYNRAFNDVIRGCSQADGRYNERGAWLGEDMISAYERLHERGYAASVDVWDKENHLVGGLYGVTIGRSFFGESMFSLEPSASKLALLYLANMMQDRGGNLIDCQFETPHLRSMGGEHIPYDRYMEFIRL
jgi:leucyl/phenylalanyl-tRNA--protein transferase